MNWLLILGCVSAFLVVGGAICAVLAMAFRVVVKTNEVHVIQRNKTTVPYGRNKPAGNVYYKWPEWIPRLGVSQIILPTSIFGVDLKNYAAYDVGRVPFMVDVKAFYQVEDPETAAQRVRDFRELTEQLTDILRGAVRKILASADIEAIMEGRGRFGDEFTSEVRDQLKAWGVSTVKNIEFMDLQDASGSKVIEDIMAKKKSLIEKESRIQVAQNKQAASEAEIQAERQVDLQKQEALEQVGRRTAEKEKAVGIASQLSNQAIQEEAKVTAEKTMAVLKVNQERQAEIDKNVAVIRAEQDKEVTAKNAEAGLIQQERAAEGILAMRSKEAEGVKVTMTMEAEGTLELGKAKAEAEKLMQMAPVEAKIALAREIGTNKGYLDYLLGTLGLEVGKDIGVAKANALANSDLKIIANSGSPEGGVKKIMDLFSAEGGTSLAASLEALAQSDIGKSLLDKILNKKKDIEAPVSK